MGRSPIDRSANKYVYIHMRNNGASLKEIRERAEDLGEKFSISALSQFFKREKYFKMKEVTNKEELGDRVDILIRRGSEVVKECIRSLEILEQLREALIVDISKDPRETTKELIPLMREVRLTVKDLTDSLNEIAQIRNRTSEDPAITAMKEAITESMPAEYGQALLESYKKHAKLLGCTVD